MATTLTVKNIRKSFPTRAEPLEVLRDVSLTLDAGESAAVMGPSGSGKSTLLNIIGTLEPPDAGSVRIDERDPFALSDRELALFRNRRIGFIFQEHHLLPQLSALENVLIPTLAERKGEDRSNRATQLLDRVGLSDRLDHRPAELSGGERQRVAIARALVNQPVLLVADEPTGNLDRATAADVADLLVEVHRTEGVALLVVTHSDRLAERFTDRWDLLDGVLSKV